MQSDIMTILASLGWMFVIGIIVYYGMYFYGTLVEKDEDENKNTV